MQLETKAALTVLIKEVQCCKNLDEINTLLNSWIKANDLHPEDVLTYSTLEELKKDLNL